MNDVYASFSAFMPMDSCFWHSSEHLLRRELCVPNTTLVASNAEFVAFCSLKCPLLAAY